MPPRELPDLSPAQVVQLQDALLSNADALLSSARAVLDLGHVGLARSLAILGLEESGKAIAVHDRRVELTHSPDGETFRCSRLDELWGNHRSKLEVVHNFLVEELYWFSVAPPDPVANQEYLGTITAWSRRHDRLKQRGFYVDLSKTGSVMTPSDVTDKASLLKVIDAVHQIGWQLRLGEHIEGSRQDEQEQGVPPVDPQALQWFEGPDAQTAKWLIDGMKEGIPGRPLKNAAYRFNPPGSDRTPFMNLGRPGYEAETRELRGLVEEQNQQEGR